MLELNVEGQLQTIDPDSPTIEIPLPQLPYNGASSVDGTVRTMNTGATSPAVHASIALLLFISGNSVGGGAAQERRGRTTPYTSGRSGGLAVTVSVARPARSDAVALPRARGRHRLSTVAWGCDLDVVFLGLP